MDFDEWLAVGSSRWKRGPGVWAWPDDTFAWCQRCDRPIKTGEPYMPRIPFVTNWGGFDHQWCPPQLVVVT